MQKSQARIIHKTHTKKLQPDRADTHASLTTGDRQRQGHARTPTGARGTARTVPAPAGLRSGSTSYPRSSAPPLPWPRCPVHRYHWDWPRQRCYRRRCRCWSPPYRSPRRWGRLLTTQRLIRHHVLLPPPKPPPPPSPPLRTTTTHPGAGATTGTPGRPTDRPE